MDDFISTLITIIMAVANWMIFKKMGYQGWEGIIPFYNTYILFKELYGNGWKFLTLLIPFYNIYVIVKLYIDLAHAFNQSTGFGVGLIFLAPIFLCILGFRKDIVYLDGSRANNEEDFVTQAAAAVGNAGRGAYENAKEKYDNAGGIDGIADSISDKAKDFADDAKGAFDSIKDKAGDKVERIRDDPMDKLRELGELRDKGIISEEEFNAKKEELLKRI